MYGKILCPVDGSPTSMRGMTEAIALAQNQGAELRFLYVVDVYPLTLDASGGSTIGELLETYRNYGSKVLDEAVTAAHQRGVQADTAIVESVTSRIGEIIIKAAMEWPADLIVMGTHGRRGIRRLLMGSDAETVIRGAPVPILLLRLPAGGMDQ